jgi:spore coat polysaccharide biosynthesis protein SpsF
MLSQEIRRLKSCSALDEIIVATTTADQDTPVADLARSEEIGCYRGSEDDVLSRFVGVARDTEADVIVRVSGDCPLVDPDITGSVIRELLDHTTVCDYASNVGLTSDWYDSPSGPETKSPERTFPRGLDIEALFSDVLFRIDRLATSPESREHVTVVPRSERRDLFLCRTVCDTEDNSSLRWTVDTEDDLKLIRILYEKLDLGSHQVSYPEILAYVRENPELMEINAGGETLTG